MSKKIAVLGTGANGASIAADLTNAGLDVVLIEQWPAHVEAMREHGVRIEMPEDLRLGALAPLQKMLDMSPAQPAKKSVAA